MSIGLFRSDSPQSDSIDLAPFLAKVFRWKWIFIALMIAGFFGGFGLGSVLKPKFDAESVFQPNAPKSSMSGQLASLSLLMGGGLDLTGNSADQDYKQIANSDAVLDYVAHKKFRLSSGDSTTLLHHLGFDTLKATESPHLTDSQFQVMELYKEMRDMLKVENQKGFWSLKVRADDPWLARGLNEQWIEALHWFNENRRRTQAQRQVSFLEDRLAEFQKNLRQSEGAYIDFQMRNLRASSPQTLAIQTRLMQEVEINRQITLEFRKQLELAKVEAVRESYVINLMQAAETPKKKSWPKRSLLALGGMIVLPLFLLGFFVVVAIRQQAKQITASATV